MIRLARMPFAAHGLLLAAAALLAGCSVLPPAKPVDTYLLPAAPAAAQVVAPGPVLPTALRVLRPSAGAQWAGSRIVVLPHDGILSVYKGAAWSDPAPVLVRNRLLDAFGASQRLRALSSDARALQADYELDSDLRAFQSEYADGPLPAAVIVLDVRLVQADTRRIVASQRFEVRQPAIGKEVPQVVQAFGQAADALTAQIVPWTLAQLQRQRLLFVAALSLQAGGHGLCCPADSHHARVAYLSGT